MLSQEEILKFQNDPDYYERKGFAEIVSFALGIENNAALYNAISYHKENDEFLIKGKRIANAPKWQMIQQVTTKFK